MNKAIKEHMMNVNLNYNHNYLILNKLGIF